MYCSHPEFWAHFLLSDLHLCSSDYLMKQVKLIHVLLGMLKNFPVEIHFPTWLVPKVWSLISVEHELLVRMVNQGLKSKQSCCSSNSFINHQSITNTCQFQQTISDPASLSNVLHQILTLQNHRKMWLLSLVWFLFQLQSSSRFSQCQIKSV